MSCHALTVDVEEWFHATALETVIDQRSRDSWESRIEASTSRMLDLFDAADAKATFFVLGWVAERHPDLVKSIAARGHEVGSHGYGHTLLTRLTPATFRSELSRAVAVCEDLTGRKILGHRAPSYSLTAGTTWALDVLIDLGIRYDSSIRRGPDRLSRPYWITAPSGMQIKEYPMTFVRALDHHVPLAAGGYFRLYPYPLTRYLLERFTERGVPANVCLHPWDLDVGQPRLRGIGWLSSFKHYVNLQTTEPKLRRLLGDFRFRPMRDILGIAGGEAPERGERRGRASASAHSVRTERRELG